MARSSGRDAGSAPRTGGRGTGVQLVEGARERLAVGQENRQPAQAIRRPDRRNLALKSVDDPADQWGAGANRSNDLGRDRDAQSSREAGAFEQANEFRDQFARQRRREPGRDFQGEPLAVGVAGEQSCE